jgi:hypothetical protein
MTSDREVEIAATGEGSLKSGLTSTAAPWDVVSIQECAGEPDLRQAPR